MTERDKIITEILTHLWGGYTYARRPDLTVAIYAGHVQPYEPLLDFCHCENSNSDGMDRAFLMSLMDEPPAHIKRFNSVAAMTESEAAE